MLHEPGEIVGFHMLNILRDVSFHRINLALELGYGVVLELVFAGSAIFHAPKASFRPMYFV